MTPACEAHTAAISSVTMATSAPTVAAAERGDELGGDVGVRPGEPRGDELLAEPRDAALEVGGRPLALVGDARREHHGGVLEHGTAVAADHDDVVRRGERGRGELGVLCVGERVAPEEHHGALQSGRERAQLGDRAAADLVGRPAPLRLEPRAARRRGARARAAAPARGRGRARPRRSHGAAPTRNRALGSARAMRRMAASTTAAASATFGRPTTTTSPSPSWGSAERARSSSSGSAAAPSGCASRRPAAAASPSRAATVSGASPGRTRTEAWQTSLRRVWWSRARRGWSISRARPGAAGGTGRAARARGRRRAGGCSAPRRRRRSSPSAARPRGVASSPSPSWASTLSVRTTPLSSLAQRYWPSFVSAAPPIAPSPLGDDAVASRMAPRSLGDRLAPGDLDEHAVATHHRRGEPPPRGGERPRPPRRPARSWPRRRSGPCRRATRGSPGPRRPRAAA